MTRLLPRTRRFCVTDATGQPRLTDAPFRRGPWGGGGGYAPPTSVRRSHARARVFCATVGAVGGLVPDFMLNKGGDALALLINGVYWHSGTPQRQHDETARIRLLGTKFAGLQIKYVVEVWDSKLFSNRDATMEAAINGTELGP